MEFNNIIQFDKKKEELRKQALPRSEKMLSDLGFVGKEPIKPGDAIFVKSGLENSMFLLEINATLGIFTINLIKDQKIQAMPVAVSKKLMEAISLYFEENEPKEVKNG